MHSVLRDSLTTSKADEKQLASLSFLIEGKIMQIHFKFLRRQTLMKSVTFFDQIFFGGSRYIQRIPWDSSLILMKGKSEIFAFMLFSLCH